MPENRDFIYSIPQTVLEDDSLDPIDLRVYAVIRSFMGVAHEDEDISKVLNMDQATINHSRTKLTQKGYFNCFIQGGK